MGGDYPEEGSAPLIDEYEPAEPYASELTSILDPSAGGQEAVMDWCAAWTMFWKHKRSDFTTMRQASIASFEEAHRHAMEEMSRLRETLSDEEIDAIADAMPGGLEGFCKGWGWRQYARAMEDAVHGSGVRPSCLQEQGLATSARST